MFLLVKGIFPESAVILSLPAFQSNDLPIGGSSCLGTPHVHAECGRI